MLNGLQGRCGAQYTGRLEGDMILRVTLPLRVGQHFRTPLGGEQQNVCYTHFDRGKLLLYSINLSH